jgi:hypothetical protein
MFLWMVNWCSSCEAEAPVHLCCLGLLFPERDLERRQDDVQPQFMVRLTRTGRSRSAERGEWEDDIYRSKCTVKVKRLKILSKNLDLSVLSGRNCTVKVVFDIQWVDSAVPGILFWFVWDRVALCSSSWSQLHNSPASASWVLGLQVNPTTLRCIPGLLQTMMTSFWPL